MLNNASPNFQSVGITKNMSAEALQYYIAARHWASDADFFKIETSFLHRLLNNYFTRLSDSAHMESLKMVGAKLLKLGEDKHVADGMIENQISTIELLTEQLIAGNPGELAVNHVSIEFMMNNLTTEYREVKKALFALVEQVMKEQALLTS